MPPRLPKINHTPSFSLRIPTLPHSIPSRTNKSPSYSSPPIPRPTRSSITTLNKVLAVLNLFLTIALVLSLVLLAIFPPGLCRQERGQPVKPASNRDG